MSEILRTRCKQGQLIITDTHIIVELGNLQSQTMLRSAFVGMDSKQIVPSLFGMGGGVDLAFRGQGVSTVYASFVPPRAARKVQALLTSR